MTAKSEHIGLESDIGQLLENLQERWHASDSDGFAAYFHPDADFVDVLGRKIRGRTAIARIHRRNFDTIHLGSRLTLEPLSTQSLGGRLALVHVRASIHVPAGPLAGDSTATQTLVLEKHDGAWQIRAFHNTFVREMPGAPSVAD